MKRLFVSVFAVVPSMNAVAASVAVQAPGVSVTANVLEVNGSSELTTETTKDGHVFVDHCGSDVISDQTATSSRLRSRGPIARASSPPGECVDTAYSLEGWYWTTTYSWYFKASTTPSGLSSTNVAQALEDGTHSITAVRNTCGMADNVPATELYLGSTEQWANISFPTCLSTTDKLSVTDFAGASPTVLAA